MMTLFANRSVLSPAGTAAARFLRRAAAAGRAAAVVAALLVAAGAVPPGFAADSSLGDLPVQHEGRIKPIDTFARVHLLSVYGKRSLPDISAIDWLMEVVTSDEAGGARPVFKIRNPEVAEALDLPEREKMVYGRDEVITGLVGQFDQLQELHRRPEEERTLVENQLVEIYLAAVRQREIARTLTCLRPEFTISDPELAAALAVDPGRPTSYFHIILHRDGFRTVLERLESRPREEWGAAENEAVELAAALSNLRHDEVATALRIVPPEPGSGEEMWFAPWELVDGRDLGPLQMKVLLEWEAILAARKAANPTAEEAHVMELMDFVGSGDHGLPKESRLRLEAWASRADLFPKSLAFYILAFLLLAASWMGRGPWLRRAAGLSLGVGVAIHFTGLVARMVVMGRPPVSTLYESIIFVGLVAALSGAIVEAVRRDGTGTFVGATIGAVLHFLGFGYAADGDTLGMLVAVLNSNFWLATHVVTITIGYGCSIVAGLAGHVYLFTRVARPGATQRLAELNRNMVGLTLVALFFTLFGTILGGIWADQSWGRFWGWDPKENGALLIVMWQLLLLHGKVSDQFKPAGFAAGLVVNNVMVALAWFGVNLLNVGLHSYGFTSNIATNLAIFCGIEFLYAGVMYPWARFRDRGVQAA